MFFEARGFRGFIKESNLSRDRCLRSLHLMWNSTTDVRRCYGYVHFISGTPRWDPMGISGQQHTAGSDPWLKIGVAVPAGYDSIVKFRFRAVRGAGFRSDMSVDDFSVMETPLCPSPFGISASNITPFSADINFTGTGNGYNVEWGVTGFPQGSGTIVNDTTNPVTSIV